MSVKAGCIKMAIKWAPKTIVLWVANKILKGIAHLSDFSCDLDSRTAYVQTTLYGETEPIDIHLQGFAILNEADGYKLFISEAEATRPWLHNVLARICGKPWKIPAIPQLDKHLALLATVFAPPAVAAPIYNESIYRETEIEDNQDGAE
jgi:hypothetical protein